MSPRPTLLIFLPQIGPARWYRLAAGEATTAGSGLDDLPPAGEAAEIVLAAPGERVSLRWLDIPDELTPAQTLAAARLALASAAIASDTDLHVAVGPAEDGRRCAALVAADEVEAWIATLAAHGLTPERIIPEPLLLLPPATGYRRRDGATCSSFRAAEEAFTLEPALAAVVVGEAPVEPVGDAAFEADLAEAIARAPLDLRQGRFAPRRSWRVDRKQVRRIGLLAVALLCVTLALPVAEMLRYGQATGRLEREVRALGIASGRSPGAAAPTRQMGFAPMSSVLFEALRATPNIELAALHFAPGTLAVTARADSPDTIGWFRERVAQSGYRVEVGATQQVGGRHQAALTVRQP